MNYNSQLINLHTLVYITIRVDSNTYKNYKCFIISPVKLYVEAILYNNLKCYEIKALIKTYTKFNFPLCIQ